MRRAGFFRTSMRAALTSLWPGLYSPNRYSPETIRGEWAVPDAALGGTRRSRGAGESFRCGRTVLGATI
jgi:hypothetical protein